VSTPLGGGTGALVAELREQAEAAVTRAAETAAQVAREVVEVREQADAVAAALEAGARQSAEAATADAQRADEAVIAGARSTAAAAIAEAEAKSASIRVTAAAFADDATAALARAEVRRESAAVQADALRLTTRREATMHRRQQLDETHHHAHAQLDAVSDAVSRLGVSLQDLSKSIADLTPALARLRAEQAALDIAGGTSEPSGAGDVSPATEGHSTSPFARATAASERLRRVRNR